MRAQWLAVQSFQHVQDLLAAINTLSIHLKLKLAHIPDEGRSKAAAGARETITSFLQKLEVTLRELNSATGKPALGVDPRLRRFANSFLHAKRDPKRFHSALVRTTLSDVQEMLRANADENQQSLIASLEELRLLLEEHVNEDAAQLLGKI